MTLWHELPGTADIVESFSDRSGALYIGQDAMPLRRSTDGGATWNPVDGSDEIWEPFEGFYEDGKGALFAGHSGGGISILPAGTNKWVHHPGPIWPSAFAEHPDGTLFVCSVGGVPFASDTIFRSTNEGLTWRASMNGIPVTKARNYNAILCDSIGTLYFCTTSSGLYRSTNGGGRWEKLSSLGLHLADTAYTVSCAAVFGRMLFVCTDYHGMYRSADGGDTWQFTGVTDRVVGILRAGSSRYLARVRDRDWQVLYSGDGGSTWKQFGNETGLDYLYLINILVDAEGYLFIHGYIDSPLYKGNVPLERMAP